jgi:hypothetical protein
LGTNGRGCAGPVARRKNHSSVAVVAALVGRDDPLRLGVELPADRVEAGHAATLGGTGRCSTALRSCVVKRWLQRRHSRRRLTAASPAGRLSSTWVGPKH